MKRVSSRSLPDPARFLLHLASDLRTLEYFQELTIRSLSLEWNQLGRYVEIHTFFGAVGKSQTLVELDLRNNEIGPDSAKILAHCISQNRVLRKLDLRFNQISISGGRGSFARPAFVSASGRDILAHLTG